MSSDQPTEQHAPGGYYSARNKIPNVQQFLAGLDKDKAERDRQLDEREAKMKAAGKTDGEVREHENRSSKQANVKMVTDPTTGRQVGIENVGKDVMKNVDDPVITVPNANLGRDTHVATDPSQSPADYKQAQDVTAPPDPVEEGTTSDLPIHGEKTNILFHPTPSVSYEAMFETLEKRAGMLCIGIVLSIVVAGKMFGGSLKGLIPLSMFVTSGVWLWMKETVRSGREVEWQSEKDRGKYATANLLPESVEWMNTFLGIAWGLVNPDMFAGVADTLEDVMQASVPGIIEAVRVAEINQGSNPIRILSLRALPDSHMRELKETLHEENKKSKDPQEAAADEEGGDFYNLECSFAYHASPSGKRLSERARNMHMQLVFYLGIKGLFGIPLPIFVELQGLVGTVRLRLNLTPDPPFLKTLTFTLMGVPHVSAGCIPMTDKGPNILNLPLISNFVNYAIGAAASMYVAPKSMTLDMRAMLQGDDITKDVQAMGVMWIRIHRAVGLSKQDKRGSEGGGSDPYITLTFSKYGKPMYCTRVITDDLNPMWEETAALLVTPELIKADENLSVELWDSDRHSADDIVGKIELSLQKLIQHPGKMFPQVSKLAGVQEGTSMPGELHWEVGFFGKPSFRPALRTDGKSKNLAKELQDKPELQDDTGVENTETDNAVMHTPPDPLWPTGIVSIIVHQIVNLELENVYGSQGNRNGKEYEPAKPYGENTDETGGKLPTSYCSIHLNDDLVYRTRAKAVSSQPIFNAGTERFVRDWRSAIVTVTVRDSRNRQHDPILGVVPLKISDILDTRSQVTRWYALDGGVGFGRVRISLLFRSVETRLPPHMLGWDVGTFEFTSAKITATGYKHHAAIKMRTGGSSGKISRVASHVDGDTQTWDIAAKDHKHDARLPVKYRYRSPVVLEFHLASKRKADAFAVVWLQHLVDNEDTEIDLPIWRTKNPDRLVQNYVTEENLRAKEVPGLEDVEEVARIKFGCRFKAGMDESHERFVSDDTSRETFETWEACISEGVRSRTVDAELPESTQQLHDASLIQGRDALKQADEKDKQRWLARDGTDWSGAFGHDPKAYMDSRGRKRREPGADPPLHDPINPSFDDGKDDDDDDGEYSGSDDDDDGQPDLGLKGADEAEASMQNEARPSVDTTGGASTNSSHWEQLSPSQQKRADKHYERRHQRGPAQWKPVRNAIFAKDEAKIGAKKLLGKITGGLEGRKPDVESETAQ